MLKVFGLIWVLAANNCRVLSHWQDEVTLVRFWGMLGRGGFDLECGVA